MTATKERLDSDNVSQYTQQSSSTTSTPQPTLKKRKSRSAKRKVSMATRRHSRMLYLEKYGLNQPGWYEGSSHDDYCSNDKNEQHDDNNMTDSQSDSAEEEEVDTIQHYTEEPQDIIPPPKRERQKQRPVSIKNYVHNSFQQKRPTRFIKPQKSNIDIMSFPATEFKHVHDLIHFYTEKVYMEGYLYKRNEFNTNGVKDQQEKWISYYIELCGPVLTLWIATEGKEEEVYPQYINITDAMIQQENSTIFSLNSAGHNRFLFQVDTEELLKKWILAIRLSCFECARIQEIYTKTFITRPQYKLLLANKAEKMAEGFIQVRFPGSTGWKKYWASIRHRSTSVKKKHRMSHLFSLKRHSNKEEQGTTSAEILFFESKKSKYPLMTLNHVVQVYTIYPESPKLINLATLFKIEGDLYKSNGHQLVGNSCLIMTSDTNELVKWLISLFDSFGLYGRPGGLLDDENNQNALNFGCPATKEQQQKRLFLDLHDVVNLVDYKSTLLNNKREFKNILYSKIMYGPTTTNSSKSRSTTSLVQSPTHLRTMTCASDLSIEGETSQVENEDNSDSDESLFKLKGLSIITNNKKSMSTPTLLLNNQQPITPFASKSNSEISSEASSASSSSSFATPKDGNKSFLPSIAVMDSVTSHYYNDSKKHSSGAAADTASITSAATINTARKKRAGYYTQQQQNDYRQRANSVIPLRNTTPMYGQKLAAASTSSVLNTTQNDYFHNNQWETSSVDPRMMMNSHYKAEKVQSQEEEEEEEEDEDDRPIAFTQNSLLYQQQQQQQQQSRMQKNGSSGSVSGAASVTGSTTSEKKKKKKQQNNNMNMMDEQMMLRERLLQQQFMIQQYMMQQQQAYPNTNGMIPMMVDPRMMQQYMMMNPQIMSAPPMMYPMDPRYFQQPIIPSPSTSTGSSYSRQQQRGYYPQGTDNSSVISGAASVTSSNGNKRPNYKRQHVSSNASVTSTSTPTSTSRSNPPPAVRRARNY